MQNIRLKKWAVILSILLFPSLLYVLFSGGKHGFKRPPVFGPKSISANGDTLYHTVDFRSINRRIHIPDSVFVVFSILSPQRDALTDRIINQLIFNHRKLDKRTDLLFISLTWPGDSNGFRQLPEVIHRDTARWRIIEMPYDSLLDFAARQLLLPPPESSSTLAFRKQLVILDKSRRIRSFLDATQYTEGKKLTDDLKVLKAEEFVKFKKVR